MSINMERHNVNFEEKIGSRRTLSLTLTDPDTGSPVNMMCACVYNTGTWKVWKPDGTIVFCGAITYSCRCGGTVTYTLGACDLTSNTCDAGIWEGEVEYLNACMSIINQSDSFGFTVTESY